MDFSLLKKLCSIPGASGDETEVLDFIESFVNSTSKNWKCKPEVIRNKHTQFALVLVFGKKPNTAIFAHTDVVGFSAGYASNLIKIGGPAPDKRTFLVGRDQGGDIKCKIHSTKEGWNYLFDRPIERGTPLTYLPNYKEDENFITSNYIDNRLGVFSALKTAESIENGVIAFTTHEEVGGGNAQVVGRFLYEKYGLTQALISDITWVTSGVQHHNGVAISARDSGIPRRDYIKRIINIAQKSKIPFQIEVEESGGSDGNALQDSPYPFDWCFIGAPEDNVHSPQEKVAKDDIISMIKMYQYLMEEL